MLYQMKSTRGYQKTLRIPMKIITSNSRGLGNGRVIRGLLDLQKKEDPDVLFLMEMKLTEDKVKGLRWKLGMTNVIVKDCEGRSGGLALFWKNEIGRASCRERV